jgi:hypothetical protein
MTIWGEGRVYSIIERMGKYLWPKVYPAWHMPVDAPRDALQGEP